MKKNISWLCPNEVDSHYTSLPVLLFQNAHYIQSYLKYSDLSTRAYVLYVHAIR